MDFRFRFLSPGFLLATAASRAQQPAVEPGCLSRVTTTIFTAIFSPIFQVAVQSRSELWPDIQMRRPPPILSLRYLFLFLAVVLRTRTGEGEGREEDGTHNPRRLTAARTRTTEHRTKSATASQLVLLHNNPRQHNFISLTGRGLFQRDWRLRMA